MKGRATYGAEAYPEEGGRLPTPFPRTIGPNALKYLGEVVEAGLASDMVKRFAGTLGDAAAFSLTQK